MSTPRPAEPTSYSQEIGDSPQLLLRQKSARLTLR